MILQQIIISQSGEGMFHITCFQLKSLISINTCRCNAFKQCELSKLRFLNYNLVLSVSISIGVLHVRKEEVHDTYALYFSVFI